MQRKRWRKLAAARGQCYMVAAKVVLEEATAVVCHGTVYSKHFDRRIDHAWVELPAGTYVEDTYGDSETLSMDCVLDLTITNVKLRLVPAKFYYTISQGDVAHRYTQDQVRALILSYGHWGPWDGTVKPNGMP